MLGEPWIRFFQWKETREDTGWFSKGNKPQVTDLDLEWED